MQLSWTVHPLKKNRQKSVFLVIILCLIGLLTLLTFNSLHLAVIALLLLVFSLKTFFIPTTYTLDSEGVKVRFLGVTSSRPWDYFRSFYQDKNGVLLSPFEKQSPLESFRGTYLLLPDSNLASEVVEFIRNHFPPSSV